MPHDFTIDSSHPELGKQPDPSHVSGEISGGSNGRRDVHVYLGNLGTGSGKYDNATVVGESLTQRTKGKRELDPASWGVSTFNAASTSTSETTSTYTPATTSSDATSSSTATSNSTSWVWDEQYKRYRYLDNATNAWVWEE